MTLNGHFALKSVSGSASNGLAFWLSDKTVLKVADLSVHCQQQKCSADTLVIYWWCKFYGVILFTGVP